MDKTKSLNMCSLSLGCKKQDENVNYVLTHHFITWLLWLWGICCNEGLGILQIKMTSPSLLPCPVDSYQAQTPQFFLEHLCPQQLQKRSGLLFFKPTSRNQWRTARTMSIGDIYHHFQHNIPPTPPKSHFRPGFPYWSCLFLDVSSF